MMYEELIQKLRSGAEYFPGYISYPDGGVQPFHLMPKDLELAADIIEDLQKERDMYNKAMTDEHNRAAKIAWEHRWIPVTERLPEKYTRVLVYSKRIRLGRNIDFMNEDGDWYTIPEVSYWMPLPEPPKGE